MQREVYSGEKHEQHSDQINGGAVEMTDAQIVSGEPTYRNG